VLIAPERLEHETLKVPVLRIFDGDGFLTQISVGRRLQVQVGVRFGFIDAPEIGQAGGAEAREFLNGLIGDQWLDLAILTKMDTGQIVDRHKRIVAIPYLAGPGMAWARNIELEMVLNGWAWVLDRYGPDARYNDALQDARRHRRGIWARDDNVAPWEFKRRQYLQRKAPRPIQKQPSVPLFEKQLSACPAAGCRGHLLERNGRFGPFYGCSSFPGCHYSRSID
jgi:micrococcal nuclease